MHTFLLFFFTKLFYKTKYDLIPDLAVLTVIPIIPNIPNLVVSEDDTVHTTIRVKCPQVDHFLANKENWKIACWACKVPILNITVQNRTTNTSGKVFFDLFSLTVYSVNLKVKARQNFVQKQGCLKWTSTVKKIIFVTKTTFFISFS